MKQKTKCGVVAVLGAPNAGKSTLVNALTGSKVSIVTPKPQTTRNRIRGIRVYDNTQIIFIDTPGIFKVQGRLDNTMNRSIVETAKNSLEGVDHIIFMIDAKKGLTEDDEEILHFIQGKKNGKILILNKIDIVEKETLLELTAKINTIVEFEKTFMISAAKNKGLEDVLKFFANALPEGQFLYPEDEITDFPARLVAAEITREKIFTNFHKEIPYSILVETEKYEESKNGIKIYQSIFTISESHKKMLIGANGQLIKRIGEQARTELTQILGKKTHLFLHVKVRHDWEEKKEHYLTAGIDYRQKTKSTD